MISPLYLFRDGGPFAYLLIIGAMTAPVPVLLWMALGAAKARVPTALYAIWPVGIVVVGIMATILGLDQALAAVAHASAEMKDTLMCAGTSVAQYTSALAGMLAVPILLVTAVLAPLPRLARGGDDAAFTPMHAIAPVALGVLGGIALSIVAGMAAGLVATVGGIAIAVASLRTSEDDDDAARIVPIRLGVTALGVFAGLLAAWTNLTMSRVMFYDAVAHASAETKQAMLHQLAEAAAISVVGPLLAAGILVVAGLAAAAPVAKHLATGRTAVHAALFGLPLIVLGASMGLLESKLAVAVELTKPWEEQRLTDLRDMGIELAPSTALKRPRLAVTLAVSPSQVWLDGVGVDTRMSNGLPATVYDGLLAKAGVARDLGARAGSSDFAFQGQINVEADRRVTLGQLQPLFAAASAAGFGQVRMVTADGADRMAVIDLEVVARPLSDTTNRFPASKHIPLPSQEPEGDFVEIPDRFVELVMTEEPDPADTDAAEPPPPALSLVLDPAGAALGGTLVPEPRSIASPDAAGAVLDGIKDAAPDHEEVAIYVSDTLTVQQLVQWLDATRENPARPIEGRARLLFPAVTLHYGRPPESEPAVDTPPAGG